MTRKLSVIRSQRRFQFLGIVCSSRRSPTSLDDGPWCRTCGGADLPRHRRRARTLPKLQGGRGGIWADAFQVSIRRDQPNRRDIKVRGRDDAGDALRSGTDHAGAFSKVVMAQGLGDEDRQTPRNEEGDRGAGATIRTRRRASCVPPPRWPAPAVDLPETGQTPPSYV